MKIVIKTDSKPESQTSVLLKLLWQELQIPYRLYDDSEDPDYDESHADYIAEYDDPDHSDYNDIDHESSENTMIDHTSIW